MIACNKCRQEIPAGQAHITMLTVTGQYDWHLHCYGQQQPEGEQEKDERQGV